MSSTANAALAEPWKDLWNGNLSLTEKITPRTSSPMPRR